MDRHMGILASESRAIRARGRTEGSGEYCQLRDANKRASAIRREENLRSGPAVVFVIPDVGTASYLSERRAAREGIKTVARLVTVAWFVVSEFLECSLASASLILSPLYSPRKDV